MKQISIFLHYCKKIVVLLEEGGGRTAIGKIASLSCEQDGRQHLLLEALIEETCGRVM